MKKDDYKKACYMLARNTTEYVNAGCFDELSKEVLGLIPKVDDATEEELVAYTLEMLKRDTLYIQEDKKYRPILVYKTEELCFGVLNHFADLIIEQLDKQGENVEIFDSNVSPLEELIGLSTKTYKAVIGIQSYLFSVKMSDGSLLHDRFDCPLYNMFFDHPTIMHQHLVNAPKNLTVITHDRNYQRFIKDNYGIRSIIIPPGGEEPFDKNSTVQNINHNSNTLEGIRDCLEVSTDKIYDISFVGSCGNYRDWFLQIKEISKKYKGLANRAISIMRKTPNITYEAAVDLACEELKMDSPNSNTYFDLKVTYLCVMQYFREQVIGHILDSGLRLVVFGESWKSTPFSDKDNLVILPQVTPQESLDIFAKSKMTLNIMSWHKDGMTERIANGMLCKTVVVSDRSDYLEEHFADGENIILFNLESYKLLGEKLQAYLRDDAALEKIANNGFAIAKANHCWDVKVAAFMKDVEKNESINL